MEISIRKYFQEANFERADLIEANLVGAYGLSIYQVSKVKMLHNAKFGEELIKPLQEKYPTIFEIPEYYD